MRMNARFSSIVANTGIGLLAASAICLILFSLRWPIVHDLGLMLYEGFLVADAGRVPYRDFFEMNPPATIAVYTLLHLLTDGNDLLIRFADIATLLVISASTVVALHQFGLRAGVLASSAFIVLYLNHGPEMTLQREMLCILLFSATVALLWRRSRPERSRILITVAGLLAGIAMMIKPPALLFWLPLLIGTLPDDDHHPHTPLSTLVRRFGRVFVFFLIGLVSSVSVFLIWLSISGGLAPFFDIVQNYYPLYREISGDGRMHNQSFLGDFRRYVVSTLPVLTSGSITALAVLGLRTVDDITMRQVRFRAIILASTVFMTLLYIPISGKFWPYHTFPLLYTLSLCAGLSVAKTNVIEKSFAQSLLVFVIILAMVPFKRLDFEAAGFTSSQLNYSNYEYMETLTRKIRSVAGEDDSILALDVTSGVNQVLYRLRRPLHGKFIYDFHFYHHVSSPFIAKLRQEMVDHIGKEPPKFIIQASAWRPSGRSCSPDFPALDSLIQRDYFLIHRQGTTSMFQRKSN
jgi:hypothetical protein